MRYGWAVLIGLSLTAGAAMAANKTSTDKTSTDWVGTWAASPMTIRLDQPAGNSTFRNIVHISLGGDTLRVTLTNEFGTTPLQVGAVHIALSAGDGKTQPNTDHALTFGGRPSVMVPAGALVISDPIAMPAAAMADLAISVYLPEQPIATPTCHALGSSTNYIATGDATAQPALDNAKSYTSWCFVKNVDVRAGEKSAAIVTLGDSITDGAHSTPDANHRWPDYLAARLQADKKTAHIAVLNQGISGNRILYDGAGPNALSRFDRDVLAQPGVKYLIILEGINDIGRIAKPSDPEGNLTADDLIFAFTQMVTRAHQHGIKVYGATLTPYLGAGYATPRGEEVREAYNNWIRTGGIVDGVIDFDKATQDPQKPTTFSATSDSGDHLHPGDAGYKAMADSIDLKLFH
jgi:lysophospholipase L1-like esterase